MAPFSFDDQVRDAAEIFRGRVVDVTAERRRAEGRSRIFTTVTFEVLETFKGAPSSPRQLDFLGGRVGDEAMIVEGMPRFEKGQELVLFVSGDRDLVCPVLGWSEGKLPVERGEVILPVRVQAAATATRAAKAIRSDERMSLGDFQRMLKGRMSQLGVSQ